MCSPGLSCLSLFIVLLVVVPPVLLYEDHRHHGHHHQGSGSHGETKVFVATSTSTSSPPPSTAAPHTRNGSCRESRLCCSGRDSSCVVQKAPFNTVSEDLSDEPCYCDHACIRLGDCCSDFKEACGVVDCEVTDWGQWSDCDASCGQGRMTRSRTVLRFPENGGRHCPSLVQKKECQGNSECELSTSLSSKDNAILPASYSSSYSLNDTKDIQRNMRLRFSKDRPESIMRRKHRRHRKGQKLQ